MVFLVSLLVYLVILLLLTFGLFLVMLMVFGTGEPAILFLVSFISVQLIVHTAGNIRKHKRWIHT
ncbi:hypothetical protein [Gracilibacillus alcaliphilus]|uniref:hypothetical protein n=1 Tax=Gracilibacillus alcaliphilus TaxID=1401441 RepID=UPI00195B0409|nr:hypothetical protein [Gracilibacillus alcaliphilus]MBM7679432.1 hypothetical protein [Gracilibacillus alcaliphilus]